MKRYLQGCFVGCLILLSFTVCAKEVAITIDDLPFVGNAGNHAGNLGREQKRFMQVVDALKAEHVPATGFVVAGYIEPGQMALIERFHQDGNIIGNHTDTHLNLNSVGADRFIANIAKADAVLAPFMTQPKYFRYPFLATGGSCESYTKVLDYLKQHDYVVVPVTIDSKDFRLNYQFYEMPWRGREASLPAYRQRYLQEIKRRIHKAEAQTDGKLHRDVKQIFLIHMNLLNAYFMKDVIDLFRQEGYQFITVPQAMQDPFYRTYEQRCEKMPHEQ